MTVEAGDAQRGLEILLVEDNPGDIRLAREAILEAGLVCQLHSVTDGVLALHFLRREAGFEGVPRPDLVLLDLNLPRKSGREVLAEIRRDPALRDLAVVVLTTSNSDRDVLDGGDPLRSRYFTKPTDLDRLIDLMRGLEPFWRSTRAP